MTEGRRRTIKLAFYAAIVIAFGWFLAGIDWKSLQGVSFQLGWLILATAIAVLFRFFGVVVWQIVLRRLGAADLPSFTVLADVYSKAWMARYIPGTLPWIAGKIHLAAEYGISKSKLAVSTLVEAAAQVVGVGAVSLALLSTDQRIAEIDPLLRWLVAIGAFALIVAMAPPVFNRLLALAMKIVRRGTAVPVQWGVILTSVSLYGLGALVSGLSYVLIVFALAPDVGTGDIVFLIGAFGLAGVVGTLTPLVPSGLGTRDGVQLLLLLVLFPTALAALIVIVCRLWSAVVDVLFWATATGMLHFSLKGDRID